MGFVAQTNFPAQNDGLPPFAQVSAQHSASRCWAGPALYVAGAYALIRDPLRGPPSRPYTNDLWVF